MNLRRGLILSALLLAAAVIWYLLPPAPINPAPGSARRLVERAESTPATLPIAPPPPAQAAPAPKAAPPSPGVAAVTHPGSVAPPFARPPQPPAGTEAEAIRSDLESVRSMVRDYRTRFGENPVGTNAEIMQAIMGGNKKGARLGPPEGAKLNGQGELVDRWGTPYFFHQLSNSDMEIRSAGPDRRLWTADDQVTK